MREVLLNGGDSQIERFPSVRTIPLEKAVTKAHKRKKRRCRNRSTAALLIGKYIKKYGKQGKFPAKQSFRAKGKVGNSIKITDLLWLRGKDLNQRPPGYEPDELPAALPRDIHLRRPAKPNRLAWL